MITLKTSVVLILAYLLALAAGTTGGLLVDRLRGAGPAAASAPLAAQLQLSSAQADQIRTLWEGVSQNVDSCYQQAQSIQDSRNQALLNLLTDDQKARFAIVDKGYARRFADLMTKRQAAFDEGVAKTESMLNPEQRAKYDQIVRQRLGSLTPGGTPAVEDVRP